MADSPAHDFMRPVFVDSTDLQDLSLLMQHVRKSYYLLLLLTPGVLKRPWCLLEIVTAVQNDVEIVPVEIVRPGAQFSYPDEDFYRDLGDGRLLDPRAARLLETQGVLLPTVADALRQVFMKIAIPFSPHKSANIRRAELHDILNRCPAPECRAD